MDEEIDKLFDTQLAIVLKLVRPNNTADDVLKITQATDNLVRARNQFKSTNQELTTKKKQGAGA